MTNADVIRKMTDENADMGMRTEIEPIIDEECIYTYCSRCGMRVVVETPSVVPTTEQSSIVHCKDCIWRDKDNQGEYYCTYAKGLADIGEDSFCSWGKGADDD